MTGQEKPKRKALHRGLDDIVRRDASLTSQLLGRVKPIAREQLDLSPSSESTTEIPPQLAVGQESNSQPAAHSPSSPAARMPSQTVTPLVSRKTPSTTEQSVDTKQTDERQPNLTTHSDQANSQSDHTLLILENSQVISYQEFVERWGYFLKSGHRIGKMRICEILYGNTYAVGKATYFTSYDKLAKLAGLEKKQCAINIKQLEDLGLVERLNIYNTATRQGTEFKLHLSQLPPHSRKSPQYHHYDEEI
jgi:hypothetical protein